MIIHSRGKIIRAYKVIVSRPKFFNRLDCGNVLDGTLIGIRGALLQLFALVSLSPAHVPETVTRVETGSSSGCLISGKEREVMGKGGQAVMGSEFRHSKFDLRSEEASRNRYKFYGAESATATASKARRFSLLSCY